MRCYGIRLDLVASVGLTALALIAAPVAIDISPDLLVPSAAHAKNDGGGGGNGGGNSGGGGGASANSNSGGQGENKSGSGSSAKSGSNSGSEPGSGKGLGNNHGAIASALGALNAARANAAPPTPGLAG